VATAKPKYSAAAFRGLLAKLVDLYVARSEAQSTEAAAKAKASIAMVEAQIKEIYELASPGFGDRFIVRFRNQRRSREDAIAYVDDRNRILVWLGEFSAGKRRRTLEEKSRPQRAAFIENRDRQMAREFLRKRNSSSSVSVLKPR
jgi:hypothetical protein